MELSINGSRHLPSRALIDGVTRSVHDVADLYRYPDRGAFALRTDRAATLTSQTDIWVTAESPWAANGSIKILQQRQAFGGCGRSALGFVQSFSMYPIIAGSTSTKWLNGRRAGDSRIDVDITLATTRHSQPIDDTLCIDTVAAPASRR